MVIDGVRRPRGLGSARADRQRRYVRLWYAMSLMAVVGLMALCSTATASPAVARFSSEGYSRQYPVVGSDGRMWMVNEQSVGGSLVALPVGRGKARAYRTPEDCQRDAAGLVVGGDGGLWYTSTCGGPRSVVFRQSVSGRLKGFPLGGSQDTLAGLTAGPGDGLWVTSGGPRTSALSEITLSGVVVRRLVRRDINYATPLTRRIGDSG